jgi:cysteine desulfurase
MPVYLDNNATTPLRDAVKTAYAEALDIWGNPSSIHSLGQQAKAALDGARRQVADLFNVRAENVVFTSGGSESNTLALRGAMEATDARRLVISPVEHPSVIKMAHALAEEGNCLVSELLVNSDGIVNTGSLEGFLKKGDVGLVSVMYANNETGIIQPIGKISDLCLQYGVPLHVDAVQVAGKLPLDFPAMNIDLLSVSFHKMGGPKGLGALIINPKVAMHAVQIGGGQERNRRAGTENVPAIVAAGVAAEIAKEKLSSEYQQVEVLHDTLEKGLKTIANNIKIVGENVERVPTTTCFIAPSITAETALMALDIEGVCISSGSACSSGKIEPSHVLLACGYSKEEALSALRVSIGRQNTVKDINTFLAAFKKVYNK